MSGIAYSIIGFILAIGILTTFHEFGHFWVARRLGVRVLRFSVGFGKRLFSWHDKDGVEYTISALPLGGYVKMLDESEGEVLDSERHLAFNNKSVFKRMAIIIAGPVFNFIFAILAYWLIFIIGTTTIVPILGSVPKGSVADIAGFKEGQEIIAVNNNKTLSWEDIFIALMENIGEEGAVSFEVKDKNNEIKSLSVNLGTWAQDVASEDILNRLGFEPFDPIPPVVGELLDGYPAKQVGFLENDLIISVNNIKIKNRTEFINIIRELPNKKVYFEVKRGKQIINLNGQTTVHMLDGGQEVGFIGLNFKNIAVPKSMIRTIRQGPIESLGLACKRTYEYSVLTLEILKKMFLGIVSLDNLGGPLLIAKYAGQTASIGFLTFLNFLALISISLGVLNLLPIPILDGGHLAYCLIELVTKKPVSEKFMIIGFKVGFVFLFSFLALAIFNDLSRLL